MNEMRKEEVRVLEIRMEMVIGKKKKGKGVIENEKF